MIILLEYFSLLYNRISLIDLSKNDFHKNKLSVAETIYLSRNYCRQDYCVKATLAATDTRELPQTMEKLRLCPNLTLQI